MRMDQSEPRTLYRHHIYVISLKLYFATVTALPQSGAIPEIKS